MAVRNVNFIFGSGKFILPKVCTRSIVSSHHDLSLRADDVSSRQASTSTPKDVSLKGVFVPLVTTFMNNTKQKICYDSMKHNLEIYERTKIAGYVVGGSNGESPYLSQTEKIELVKFVREHTHPSRPVIAGSTAESTAACCELTKAMADAGADAVLIMPPFYFRRRMTDEALKQHYLTVADQGGLPIVIYNMPVVSGIDISTNLLAKLAQHPNIRAVKDSDVRKCANTARRTKGHNFDVLIGSAGYLLPALINGCSGGINGLAGALPNEVASIYHQYKEGALDKATELQRRICHPDTLLLAELGVPALKHAMDILGLFGGLCRRPILPPSLEDKQAVRECLSSNSFLPS